MTHECAHTSAVLLGEAPWPGDDRMDAALDHCEDCRALHEALHDVDSAAAALPVLAPPPQLRDQTLALVMDELAPPRRRRPWLRVLAGGLAAAAALVVLLPRRSAPPPPSELVERGVGERLPETALKIAVQTRSGLERLRTDRSYGPGDTLRFRASLDQPATVGLVRATGDDAELIAVWQLPAGEHELSADEGALAWRIEPGETTATFALLAGPPDRDPAALDELAPRATESAGTLCAAARSSGWACDAHVVEVAP